MKKMFHFFKNLSGSGKKMIEQFHSNIFLRQEMIDVLFIKRKYNFSFKIYRIDFRKNQISKKSCKFLEILKSLKVTLNFK